MKKEVIPLEKLKLPPGVGVAGEVICPFLSLNKLRVCAKDKCEMWVELDYDTKKVARCSFGWLAVLSTEIRSAIDRIAEIKK